MADGGRSVHAKALPNYATAEIPSDKLLKYALDPTHEARDRSGSHGKNKARLFKGAREFDQSNWEVLKQRILDELPYNEAVLEVGSRWGEAYRVDMQILGVNGKTASVRTAWLIRHGTDHATLITLWVLPKGA